jgi:hypothetical protein
VRSRAPLLALVVAETFTTTDPLRPSRAPFTTMADAAASAGAITGAEAVSWLAELADAGPSGCFFWAVTMFAGRRRAALAELRNLCREEERQ